MASGDAIASKKLGDAQDWRSVGQSFWVCIAFAHPGFPGTWHHDVYAATHAGLVPKVHWGHPKVHGP